MEKTPVEKVTWFDFRRETFDYMKYLKNFYCNFCYILSGLSKGGNFGDITAHIPPTLPCFIKAISTLPRLFVLSLSITKSELKWLWFQKWLLRVINCILTSVSRPIKVCFTTSFVLILCVDTRYTIYTFIPYIYRCWYRISTLKIQTLIMKGKINHPDCHLRRITMSSDKLWL